MCSLQASALLSGRLWASLVTFWLTAGNRTVPKTSTPCFSISISLFSSISSYFSSVFISCCPCFDICPLPRSASFIFAGLLACHLYPLYLFTAVIMHSFFPTLFLFPSLLKLYTNLFQCFKVWFEDSQTHAVETWK